MKTITKLGLAVTMFMATAMFNSTMAQTYYGGSAYVHVKDDQGNSRVVTATVSCAYSTEADAKRALEPVKGYNEEFNSQIYYSIDRCSSNDDKYYGGSSSARVKDSDGNSRVVTATVSCAYSTVSDAKKALEPVKSYNEEFISGITYDIDSCN
ncbi:hypothetical protein NU10_04175 [Flavobacterium dauae]|uniref:hypothetical protein n=1 Tax=Flavobacterium dauae TaxID=1563479 RepID=UPI00101B3067|nr:hypothetical protein [Flavobacterium dauae]WLD24602.1 hypothetical protein NU10_04175 [Flavobacterium dauae]